VSVVLVVLCGLLVAASVAALVLAWRAHRALARLERRPTPGLEDIPDLASGEEALDVEKLSADARRVHDDFRRVHDDFSRAFEGLFAPRRTAVSILHVICPACRARNRLTPGKTGDVRCGKCGLPCRLTILPPDEEVDGKYAAKK
jgi:hypothetical protein